MIAKMKKYTFLVFHKEYEKFLEKIRELGVMHVQTKESGIPEDADLAEQLNQSKEIVDVVTELEKRNDGGIKYAPLDVKTGEDVLATYKTLVASRDKLQQDLQKVEKDAHLIQPWGNFSFETLAKIKAEQGYDVRFYSCNASKYNADWEKEFGAFKISSAGSSLNFVTVTPETMEIEIDADIVKLPSRSLDELAKAKSLIEQEQVKAEEAITNLSGEALDKLIALQKQLQQSIELSNVKLGTQSEAEDRLMILEGWVPVDEEQSLLVLLKQQSVYYETRKAAIKDTVPVLLKNSAFAKLFESIGELYTLPSHKELDLTPFFAPFYMLFFGFCLGDAGYGLLIMLGTLIGLGKVKANVKPLMILGFLLGLSTTLMGVVGGTFFGIMLHPDDYKYAFELSGWLKTYQGYILSSDNLMLVALGLGYFQVIFAMFINLVNKIIQLGFKHGFAQMGWIIIVMITIPFYAMGTMEIISVELANKVAMISGIVGAIPALFMNTPGKNIFLNFGTGLWDAYGMASGLLGDVLSYIRLFALGISSAILGNVFNSLAMDLSPDTVVLRQIVMILILLFGHGLNFFMAALGSFVHPLRLTFVEFYKNAGFEGGGVKYAPFKEVN